MSKDWPKRVRLGINGFGHVARTLLRCALEDSRGLEVVAINEPSLTPEQMIYLIKYDSILGPFKGYLNERVHVNRASENAPSEFCSLEIAGRMIAVFQYEQSDQIPWNWLNVEYVLETTGDCRHLAEATVSCRSICFINMGSLG
ncbi:unnamed protein product [Echinostoma caproni]|uniref:Gp_dh_N domain-containing protein n=1 Tax=Echinostoma caproni TaxID=27848 RepID=A0A183AJH2_9TREM|nr:unnamed protein product [Echinostoma caproni]